MKKLQAFSIVVVFTLLVFTSCDRDFEEININPNNPQTVPVSLILPNVIAETVSNVTASHSMAGQFAQHTAQIGSNSGGRFLFVQSDFRSIWNNPFRTMKDIQLIIELSRNQGNPATEAIGLIWKAYTASFLTDAFGDIPYSQAGRGNESGLEFPEFQSQEEVYRLLLEDLTYANELLGTASSNTQIAGDILFGGNMLRWQKFANSLKLRLLMRKSGRDNVASEVAEIFNNPTQYPVFENNEEQATLVYNNTTDFYRWYLRNPPSTGIDFRSNQKIGATMVDKLKSEEDPRLFIYAAPTKNSFDLNQANPSETLQYVGQPIGLNDQEQSALNVDDFSGLGISILRENRAFLMTYAELLFIKAEASFRDMIEGNPEEFYNSAIAASFDKYDISSDDRNIYFEKESNKFNPSTGLRQIAEQRWVDAFLNGYEGWSVWRRLGYPTLQPGPSVQTQIPTRYFYSDTEVGSNPNASSWISSRMNGQDSEFSRVWWDVD